MAGSITALVTSLIALVGAVTALVKLIRHTSGPAHKQ